MIICTRCGTINRDDSRFCGGCRKKLQSSRSPANEVPVYEPLRRLNRQVLPESQRRELARMVEAWLYALALILAAGICQYKGLWWPMWPTLGLIALLAVLRLR